jgi:hypothetical protein
MRRVCSFLLCLIASSFVFGQE